MRRSPTIPRWARKMRQYSPIKADEASRGCTRFMHAFVIPDFVHNSIWPKVGLHVVLEREIFIYELSCLE